MYYVAQKKFKKIEGVSFNTYKKYNCGPTKTAAHKINKLLPKSSSTCVYKVRKVILFLECDIKCHVKNTVAVKLDTKSSGVFYLL